MKRAIILALSSSSLLFAEDAAPSIGAGSLTSIPMLIVMFVVFWFLIIQPERKRQKEGVTMRDALKKGDKVITSGGIYGTIKSLQDEKIVLTVSKGLELTVLRTSIGTREEKLNKALEKESE